METFQYKTPKRKKRKLTQNQLKMQLKFQLKMKNKKERKKKVLNLKFQLRRWTLE